MKTTLIKLETCYRCGPSICAAATSLIRHNVNRIDKDVVPAAFKSDSVVTRQYATDLEERGAVGQQVAQEIYSGTSAGECAVLLRSNFLAQQFADALRAAGVPVATAATRQLPDDWQAALDVLNLWLDPRNDYVAERVLRRMAPGCVDAAKHEATAEGAWLSTIGLTTTISVSRSQDISYSTEMLSRFGISREMQQLVAERISLLPQADPRLADLLHDLYSNANWQEPDSDAGVHVGTYHSFKGKEATAVWLPALEEGILPIRSVQTAGEEAEERRLFFVGVTRARRILRVSHCQQRRNRWTGRMEPAAMSRFVAEAALVPET